jgi:hypothetical protein
MEGDRGLPLKSFLHPVDKTEAARFVVLILIVRLRLLLQIAVVFRWLVFVLLGDARHSHIILCLYVRVNVGRVGIRAGSPRLAHFIEAAVAVGAIAVGAGQRLRRAVSSLATRHAESISCASDGIKEGAGTNWWKKTAIVVIRRRKFSFS